MTPAAPGPTSKRKAPEDSTTLMKATKKAKKDPASKSSKRKLFNGEEQPGGFIIARGPSAQPPSRAPSVPPSATANGTEPPPKRKRTGSTAQAAPSRLDVPNPRSRDPDGQGPCVPTRSSPELDEDAQAMTTEADELRRSSRNFNIENPPATQKQHRRRLSVVDRQIPIPDTATESPTIARNRALRDESMGLRKPDDDSRGRDNTRTPNGNRRRSSSNARGKRISDAGAIPTPHKSVSDSSLCKHIDPDQSEPERLRHLVYCLADRRALDPDASLTPNARQLVTQTQDAFIAMLHQGKISLPTYHTDPFATGTPLKPNKFNVTNAQWEEVYTQRNDEAEAQDEEWKGARHIWDERIKTGRAKLEKDKQTHLSNKAKGKQRADGSSAFNEVSLPQDHLIHDEITRRLVASARDLITSGTRLARTRRERLDRLAFDVDQLRDAAHSARTLVRCASDVLDSRFAFLGERLLALGAAPYIAGGGSAQVLNAYARPGAAAADPAAILRALARVDGQRPAARLGDAAQNAARELRKLDERGVGERRLTAGVVPPTPKRLVPGTPKRGTTPGRSTTPGR